MGSLLILSGSLPRGVPLTAYAQLIRLAHCFGVRTLLDCGGALTNISHLDDILLCFVTGLR